MSANPADTRYDTQRSAAAKNRATILEAAHDLLGENPSASMNEIGKRAEVGAGTLYRHFPSREALILAVYQHDVERLVSSVDNLLDELPTAKSALIDWFMTLAAYIRVKHGLGEALHNAAIQKTINETYAPALDAVTRLLGACVDEGSVRPDANPSDVLLLMGFLWRTEDGPDGAAQAERLIQLVFEGLQSQTQLTTVTSEQKSD